MGSIDGPGFHVEPDVLQTAARSMGEITRKQGDFSLSDLCGPYEQYGHDGFCDALDNFCNAYSESMDMLVDKADDLKDGLNAIARAYRDVDRSNQKILSDPGIQTVEDYT